MNEEANLSLRIIVYHKWKNELLIEWFVVIIYC